MIFGLDFELRNFSCLCAGLFFLLGGSVGAAIIIRDPLDFFNHLLGLANAGLQGTALQR